MPKKRKDLGVVPESSSELSEAILLALAQKDRDGDVQMLQLQEILDSVFPSPDTGQMLKDVAVMTLSALTVSSELRELVKAGKVEEQEDREGKWYHLAD